MAKIYPQVNMRLNYRVLHIRQLMLDIIPKNILCFFVLNGPQNRHGSKISV